MKKLAVYSAAVLTILSGCIVRTYSLTKDRVDQDISGNQGYISGSAPVGAQSPERAATRTTRVVEVELRSPIKFEKLKEPPKPIEQEAKDVSFSEGNSGYAEGETVSSLQETQTSFQVNTYIVKKDDTLQKISARPEIYGTTKKWMKIYEANKDALKSPNKIRPGQELKIPRD